MTIITGPRDCDRHTLMAIFVVEHWIGKESKKKTTYNGFEIWRQWEVTSRSMCLQLQKSIYYKLQNGKYGTGSTNSSHKNGLTLPCTINSRDNNTTIIIIIIIIITSSSSRRLYSKQQERASHAVVACLASSRLHWSMCTVAPKSILALCQTFLSRHFETF